MGLATDNQDLVVENATNGVVSYKGQKYQVDNFGGIVVYISPTFDLSQVKVGDYVYYNVPYIDMYSDTDTNTNGLQGYNFTATDGWRILSITQSETNLSQYDIKIISTGVPALLHYDYTSNPTSPDNANNAWWGTTNQVNSTYNLGINSWSKDYSGYYAAYGLLNNFNNITFDNGTSQPIYNKGCWQSVAGKTSGTGADFIASGYTNISVHNLTLAELNIARGLDETSVEATSNINGDGDTGLFYLQNLANENPDFGYPTSSVPNVLLASPVESSQESLYYVAGYSFIGTAQNPPAAGVRPVISISGITMTQDTTTGIWTINQNT